MKRRVKKILCHPSVGFLLGFLFRDRIPAWGCRIDTSSRRITYAAKASLFWRSYEGAEIRFVRRYLREDLDVVELGSSIGVLSCQLRRKMNAGTTLVIVEADPELVQLAERNLATNTRGRVCAVNAAVAYDGTGDRIAFSRGAVSEAGRVDAGGAGDYSVSRISLAEIIDRHELRDFALVADIEGAEAGLIAHDSDAMAFCRQIIIELHDTVLDGRRVDPDAMLSAFRELGFRLVDRHGNVCVLER